MLATALRVFFREIAVVGDELVPTQGPLILAGNHPNSLIDPALLVAVTQRQVRFAAKDVLFRSALLRPVLLGLGAVPIARRADHGTTLDNGDAFATLTGVLAAGGAMGIFPEGLSHDDAHLHDLKTGAARIALQTALAGVAPVIVPVGLNYMRAKRFRSRVLVQYGAPLTLDAALLAQAKTDLHGAARRLTNQVEGNLRALTVNAADWPTLRVLDAVRRLYQPPGISLSERVELARRFNAAYPQLAHEPDVAAVFARVQAWLERLEAAGLYDRDLQRNWRPIELAGRAVGHVLLLGLWLPLALAGGVLHAPMGLAIGLAGPLVSPRKDVVATTKLLMGLLAMPAVAAALVGATWHWLGGWAALAAAILMPISGLATLRVLERGLALQRLLTTSTRIFALRRELGELRAEQAELEKQVVELVSRHKPHDMVMLFPRDEVDL